MGKPLKRVTIDEIPESDWGDYLPQVSDRVMGSFIPNVPDSLATRVMPLPGKTYQVFSVLWKYTRCRKRDALRLTTGMLAKYGLSRTTGYRALCHLEKAGLIRVERSVGKYPLVTLLPGSISQK
jgi:hypothetical protein